MSSRFSLAALPAVAAAFLMIATPVVAADLPALADMAAQTAVAPAWTPGSDTAQDHRGYRYRRYRGSGVGDVLTGILIIGGIAAVANAATRSSRSYPARYPDARYPYPRGDDRSYDGDTRGLDRAISLCADEVERNARIGSIDAANRTAVGWTVSGALYNGQGFTCSIGADGRIEAIDYGQGAAEPYRGSDAAQGYEGGQYGDDVYAEARVRTQGDGASQPAYPGGPLPGEGQDDQGDYASGV